MKLQKNAIILFYVVLALSVQLGRMGSLQHAAAQTVAKVDIENTFSPSGWLGDGEYERKYVNFNGADRTHPHSAPSSIRITYRFGSRRWGGIYWLNKPDNWGDQPGDDYSSKKFSRVSFWARGERGGEIVEFKAGGITNPAKRYGDSFGATTGRISLSNDWREYQIDLSRADLRSVIGGFCWIASQDNNSAPVITFYLDDILME
jgi:hypothetical protein